MKELGIYLCAEVGVAWDSKTRLKRLIKDCLDAGADAVKLQLFNAKTIGYAKTLKATVTAKDTELATLRAEKATRLREEEITAELTAAKFPVADTALFSATFKEELFATTDKAKRAEKIKDRMALASGRLHEGRLPAPTAVLTDPNAARQTGDPSMNHLFGATA